MARKEIIFCNGIVLTTATDISDMSPILLSSIDYKIQIEDYNRDNLKQILIQQLKYHQVIFDNEVLDTIFENCTVKLEQIYRLFTQPSHN